MSAGSVWVVVVQYGNRYGDDLSVDAVYGPFGDESAAQAFAGAGDTSEDTHGWWHRYEAIEVEAP